MFRPSFFLAIAVQIGRRPYSKRCVRSMRSCCSWASRLNVARLTLRRGGAAEVVEALEEISREADGLGLRYVAAESSILLAEALLETGDAARARRRLELALTTVERSRMRVLIARSRALLGRVERASGNTEAASRHFAQVRRILEEIREEAGDDDPLRRQDLRSIYDEAEPVADG